MSSREKILASVAANQPELSALPDIDFLKQPGTDLLTKFVATLTAIGGKAIEINSYNDIINHIKTHTTLDNRVACMLPELANVCELLDDEALSLPHSLNDVELAIVKAHFGVAENGAVWVTEEQMGHRVLPFICQHLAVVISAENIFATMHHAYDYIGDISYGFGTFIAGPSKTADIEQSLVIGAHGPRSMTVFIMKNQ